MINPTFDMKRAFFDRKKIIDAVDRATRKALSKSLAYVRTGIRSGYRRRKKTSRPGQSPSVHSTSPVATLKYVLFAYDSRTKSGVVGPVKINGRRSMATSNKEVPGLLEEGGILAIPQESWDGKTWYPQTRRRRTPTNKKKRVRRVVVRARPNVAPALAKEIAAGNISSPWANVITG